MKKHNNIQQGTESWHHIRKGKITGTTLKAIMGTPKARQEAIYEIIAERLTVGVDMDYENAMDRGTRLEPEAIAMFELQTGLQVQRTGFCQHDENTAIANSPDGLIDENAAVEAKCPEGKNYVKMWITNQVPEQYYWQCIQYFVVNESLDTLYFIGYNPDIQVHPLHIIEMLREDVLADIKTAEEYQYQFLDEVNAILGTIIEF